MKYALLIMIAGVAFAQDVKVPAKMDAKPDALKPNTERPLTKEESLELQLTSSRILRLQDRYKLSDYQAELQPIISEQQAVFMKACASVGIPEDKVATECRINTGVDADGKPVLGPDNKPLAPRVWREVAKASESLSGKEKN